MLQDPQVECGRAGTQRQKNSKACVITANFLLKEISKKKKGNLSSFRNINQDQYVKLQYKFVEVDCYIVEKVQIY